VAVVKSFYLVVSSLVSVIHRNVLVFSAKTWGFLSYCHPWDPTGISESGWVVLHLGYSH